MAAVVKTPETSVTSEAPLCIDPHLLDMLEAMQPYPQPNEIVSQPDTLTNTVPWIALCPVYRIEVDGGFLE